MRFFAAEPRYDCVAPAGSDAELVQDDVGAEGGNQPPESGVLRSPCLPGQMAEPGEKEPHPQPDGPFHEVVLVHLKLLSDGLRPCNYSTTLCRRDRARTPMDNHARAARKAL